VRRGAFPGTFNPPTVAHLAVAEAAREHHRLDRVDLVISRRPLAKAPAEQPAFEQRVEVVRRLAVRLGWLHVVVSELQLIADLAHGYDLVIMGADKWHQIHDVAFYDHSPAARDAALARLPALAVVPRAGFAIPDEVALDVDPAHLDVSSTRARSGEHDLMVPEALDSGLWHRP